ncbi:MAG: hypothetical protein FGM40_04340 [Rhodocyclaceae bacterium]|nr:hypothetical protein [Rhodocyclaceae bacterium]
MALVAAGLLAGCADPAIKHKDGTSSKRGFMLASVAKGDIDDVTETHQQAMLQSLRTLALKFYKRNPREFRKGGFAEAEPAVEALFAPLDDWARAPLREAEWTRRLAEAWQPDFAGDRVRALVEGMLVMCMASYDHHREFFLTTQLDPQKLYNSARNLEAVAWKIGHARTPRGELVLLSNSMDADTGANLSFEREFGKLIATQDNLALIIEDKGNRTIRTGMVNLATMAFLPIPIK